MKKSKKIKVKPHKKVSISHFKSEITIGLEEGYTQKLIDKSEVIGFLQKFQDNLIENEDIYLSAKVTVCDIVWSFHLPYPNNDLGFQLLGEFLLRFSLNALFVDFNRSNFI
jgi:hypothetical protein